jgi:hypothetical protein
LTGDAVTLTGAAIAGHDCLTGGNSFGGYARNSLFGDARMMRDSPVAGNDVLHGGNSFGTSVASYTFNTLIGDSENVLGPSCKGGNDTLIGGNSSGPGATHNTMFGDFFMELSGTNFGGNDVLIAGTARNGGAVSNEMWGDLFGAFSRGGSDTFVFKDSGQATVGTDNMIGDFRQTDHDVIELDHIKGVRCFSDLSITYDDLNGGEAVIHAGSAVITLHNFTGTLHASDFLFG